MNDDEKELWAERLCKDGDVYHLNITDEKKLDEIDDKLLTSIVLTYQLGHMSEVDLRIRSKKPWRKILRPRLWLS